MVTLSLRFGLTKIWLHHHQRQVIVKQPFRRMKYLSTSGTGLIPYFGKRSSGSWNLAAYGRGSLRLT